MVPLVLTHSHISLASAASTSRNKSPSSPSTCQGASHCHRGDVQKYIPRRKLQPALFGFSLFDVYPSFMWFPTQKKTCLWSPPPLLLPFRVIFMAASETPCPNKFGRSLRGAAARWGRRASSAAPPSPRPWPCPWRRWPGSRRWRRRAWRCPGATACLRHPESEPPKGLDKKAGGEKGEAKTERRKRGKGEGKTSCPWTNLERRGGRLGSKGRKEGNSVQMLADFFEKFLGSEKKKAEYVAIFFMMYRLP